MPDEKTSVEELGAMDLFNRFQEEAELNGSEEEELDLDSSNEDEADDSDTEDEDSSTEGEGDLDEDDGEDLDQDEDSDSDEEDDPSDRTIKFKASGEEKEVNLEEAAKILNVKPEDLKSLPDAAASKLLSKTQGADAKLRDAAKYRQQNKTLLKEVESLKKDVETLDTFDKILVEDGLSGLIENLSGKSFDEFLDEQIEERNRYRGASQRERDVIDREKALDKKDRIKEAQKKKDEEKEANNKNQASKKFVEDTSEYVQTLVEDLDLSPRLKQMLINSSVSDVQGYIKQGHSFSKKLIRAVITRNANELNGTIKTKTKSEIVKADSKRKANAKKKAQLAATSSSGDEPKDFSLSDVTDFFSRQGKF